jgi:hypothetical protein
MENAQTDFLSGYRHAEVSSNLQFLRRAQEKQAETFLPNCAITQRLSAPACGKQASIPAIPRST